MRTRFTMLLPALALIASAAFAQDLSGFEKVLIPLCGGARGANGSSFFAYFTMYSDTSVRFYPSAAPDAVDGIATVQRAFLPYPPCAPGMGPLVVFVKESGAPVFFTAQLRSSDAAALAPEQVTSVPVVRESELQTSKIVLSSIPSTYRYEPPDGVRRSAIPILRHMLRVYDVDSIGGREVRVRMTPEGHPGFTPILDFIVRIDRRDGTRPADPWYAQMPLEPHCMPFSQHTPCLGGSARFEIEPVGEPFRYWAMISVTDNVTQHATIFEP